MRRADLQPVFDKIVNRVAGWRGKNIGLVGRSTLVKYVLTAQPIYLLTALKVTKEALEQLDTKRRSFLWAGAGTITGGKCKINWKRTCLPTSQGGLGILNMEKFTRALRLRWLWQQWRDPTKPWVVLETPCDEMDKLLFAATTQITIGDGRTVRFWDSAWIDGQRPKNLMPLAFAISKKRKKSLRQGIKNDAWIDDLDLNDNSHLTVDLVNQLVALWDVTQAVHLEHNEPDHISWKLTNHEQYSASSTYKA